MDFGNIMLFIGEQIISKLFMKHFVYNILLCQNVELIILQNLFLHLLEKEKNIVGCVTNMILASILQNYSRKIG
jgi:hypothetical protein